MWRRVPIQFVVVCWLAACGDDSDGMASTADAGPAPLIDLVRREIADYDRRVRASCVCAFKAGSYPTEQACLDVGLSGPDWAECATKALAEYDSAATRADSQCFRDFQR